jgi:hypothetical protein
VLELYQRVVDGTALGQDEYVISADEKTQVQARCRCHPTLPTGRARVLRVEHEYDRGGALAYLAAWDVHQARLFGRLEPTTGIAPFGRLVEQVMTTEPYASAKRVFWVVDNGSSHRGQASVKRLEGKWRNLRLIHLPVHASWLNQIEIYFSIVQRKVLTPNDFVDLAEVEARLLGFQHRYEQTAVPFDWRYTKADLDRLLRRLTEHEQLAQCRLTTHELPYASTNGSLLAMVAGRGTAAARRRPPQAAAPAGTAGPPATTPATSVRARPTGSASRAPDAAPPATTPSGRTCSPW